MEIFVLFLLGSLQVGSALDIMACNCSQAEIVGLMDIQQPSYCDERLMQQKPVPTKYAFFITEEPHSTWKGNLCMTWLKEKNITRFFFGGFDTTTALNIQKVSVRECREIIETHDCSGNKMEQIGPDLYAYKAEPIGEGTWMQQKEYIIRNCVEQQITLKKDCLACPITSPYGILTNSSTDTSAMTHDATIVWSPMNYTEDEKCKVKKIHDGNGIKTKLADNTFKLIDETNQLEFHFQNETFSICNHQFHKLLNIDNAYIEIEDKNNRSKTHLYNPHIDACLKFNGLILEKCQIQKKFAVSTNLVIQPEEKKDACFTFHSKQLNYEPECKTKNTPSSPLIWNPYTSQITDGHFCLQAEKDLTVSVANCTQNENQQWQLGAPQHETENTDEENQPLLAQHHQFIEDKAVARDNKLEEEIKAVYCGNLQLRRFTTLMLAESNGLLAAIANNLPVCHRLKPNGKHLIVQKCGQVNLTISAAQTKCGFEPVYQNYTIGRDGYSLHPFQECFWKDGVTNLNGLSYTWNTENNAWIQLTPTFHLSTLKLTAKFKELDDNEYKYTLRHHKAFESNEFEQLNVLNELVTRIHEVNADSLSSLVVNSRSESRFWNISSWTITLKSIFLTLMGTLLLSVIIYTIVSFARLRIRRHQKDVTNFAIRLQEAAQRSNNVCESSM